MSHLSAVLAFGAALPKSLTEAFLGVCHSLKERRARTWAAGAPDHIDDHFLRDIGVSRSDLMAAERLRCPRRRGGQEGRHEGC